MKQANPSSETMPASKHLAELRNRLIKIFLILLTGTAIAGIYSKEIFGLLEEPLARNFTAGTKFIALSPLEGWIVYLKVAFVTSIFFSAPLWLYQVWAFLTPALIKREQAVIIAVAAVSSIFFIGGGFFCYFAVLPTGFRYLLEVYSSTDVTMLPQMQWYLSFILRTLFAFGIVFETPLFMMLLARLGLVSSQKMRRTRKYAVVGIFIFAAVMTPGPDVFSQVSLALPLILFYELGIWASFFAEKKCKGAVVSSGTI